MPRCIQFACDTMALTHEKYCDFHTRSGYTPPEPETGRTFDEAITDISTTWQCSAYSVNGIREDAKRLIEIGEGSDEGLAILYDWTNISVDGVWGKEHVMELATRAEVLLGKPKPKPVPAQQLYAFIDNNGELLISDTTNLDRYSNDGVVFNLETRMFDTVSWYDGVGMQIHSSHLTPADAIAAMKELT